MLTSLELRWKQRKSQVNKYKGVRYRPDPQSELAAPGLRTHTPKSGGAQPQRGRLRWGCDARGSPHAAKRHGTTPASPARQVPAPPRAPTRSSTFPRYLLGVGYVSPSLSATRPGGGGRAQPAGGAETGGSARPGGSVGGRGAARRLWAAAPAPARRCAVSLCRRCCSGLPAERAGWFSP